MSHRLHGGDSTKHFILLDFGSQVVAGSYRFAASGHDQWDPVSWRFEGSRDGSTWVLLDQQTGFATPMERDTYIPAVALIELPPPVDFRVTAMDFTTGGTMVRLTWNSQAGASYRIETNATLQSGSWTTAATGIPSQGTTTSHELPRGGAPTLFYRIVRQ